MTTTVNSPGLFSSLVRWGRYTKEPISADDQVLAEYPLRLALFTQTAIDEMLAEFRKYPDTETVCGFLGLVPTNPTEPLVVLGCAPGGDQAHRSLVQTTSDPRHDDAMLRYFQEEVCPLVVHVGKPHTHPGNMKQFSQTDERTAQEQAAFYNGPYLCVIVTHDTMYDVAVPLNVYGLNSPDEPLRAWPYEIVVDDDPRILETLSKAPVPIAPPDTTHCATFFDDPGFSFVRSTVGQQRLRDEIDILSSEGIESWPSQRPGEGHVQLVLQVDGMPMHLCLPPEFPLNPPRVWVGRPRREYHPGIQRVWSSDRSLLELIQSL